MDLCFIIPAYLEIIFRVKCEPLKGKISFCEIILSLAQEQKHLVDKQVDIFILKAILSDIHSAILLVCLSTPSSALIIKAQPTRKVVSFPLKS